MAEHDNVNHPLHYTFGGIEVLDAIEAWELPYHLGNCVKYIARAGRKDPTKTVEDLKKARFYLDRYIGNLDKPEPITDKPSKWEGLSNEKLLDLICKGRYCSSSCPVPRWSSEKCYTWITANPKEARELMLRFLKSQEGQDKT